MLNCDVNTGTGAERVRVIELGRNGSGVIGWDLPSAEVVNGTDCAADPDDVIRRPWWNTSTQFIDEGRFQPNEIGKLTAALRTMRLNG